MSLRDGIAKMSKSDASDMSRINLSDDDDTIAQKIRKAKTDPEPCPRIRRCSTGRPEARNLVGIYAALSDERRPQSGRPLRRQGVRRVQAGAGRRAGRRCCAAPRAARRIAQRPGRDRRDPGQGRGKAAALAAPTLAGAYRAIGLPR